MLPNYTGFVYSLDTGELLLYRTTRWSVVIETLLLATMDLLTSYTVHKFLTELESSKLRF